MREHNTKGIVKRSNAYFIDPKEVVRKEGWNPRFDFGEIEALAKSIKSNGILNPIRVKHNEDGKFEIIDGDRRLTAIEFLMKEGETFDNGIPAIIENKNIDEITSLVRMFESNSGKPFLPLEEAAAYKRFRDAGLTIQQICKSVSRSVAHVTNTLALISSDEWVKEALRDGHIDSTIAKSIAVKARGKKDKQKELVEKAMSGKKGKKAVKEELENTRLRKGTGRRSATRSLTDEQIQDLETKCLEELKELQKACGGIKLSNMKHYVEEYDSKSLSYGYGILVGLRMARGIK